MRNATLIYYIRHRGIVACMRQYQMPDGYWVAAKLFLLLDINDQLLDEKIFSHHFGEVILPAAGDCFASAIFQEFIELCNCRTGSDLANKSILVTIDDRNISIENGETLQTAYYDEMLKRKVNLRNVLIELR